MVFHHAKLCAISSKNKLKATHNYQYNQNWLKALCAISSKNKLKATHNTSLLISPRMLIVRNIFKEQIESNSQPLH